ncbi:hypothetical protein QJS10_CPA01g00812 [Acorus calamus]|uniref:VQ domain-containing protein n=1 Tax=Acorus calamus TaxID=4465 RepID=A0AAV9FK39_ACOCL|nr:hypothetical protein QJS10_CPA01g00812 [Acorus calamus]
MAMSDSTTPHSDWVQTFQRAWSNPLQQPPPSAALIASEASAVTAASSSNTAHPATEGRVGKTPRRRSRASRKPPTTLLNTDPLNFRAMVQRFTGVPSGGSRRRSRAAAAHDFVLFLLLLNAFAFLTGLYLLDASSAAPSSSVGPSSSSSSLFASSASSAPENGPAAPSPRAFTSTAARPGSASDIDELELHKSLLSKVDEEENRWWWLCC